ncbi:MAG: ATP-binding protein [Bacteroidota bacterium]
MDQQSWLQYNQDHLKVHIRVLKATFALALSQKTKSDNPSIKQELSDAKEALSLWQVAQTIPTNLEVICKNLGLTSFEEKVLLTCAGIEMDSNLCKLLQELQAPSGAINPTLTLLMSVFEEAHWSAITHDGPLCHWALINLRTSSIYTHSSVSIDPNILHFLFGWNLSETDGRIRAFTTYSNVVPLEVKSHRAIAQQVVQALQGSNIAPNPFIELSGTNAKDKVAIATQVAQELGHQLLELNGQLLPIDPKELDLAQRLLNRFTFLSATIWLIDLEAWPTFDTHRKAVLNHFFLKLHGTVLLCSQSPIQDLDRNTFPFQVQRPSREEQQSLWKSQLNLNGQSTASLQEITYQFSFEALTLQALAQQAQLKMPLAATHSKPIFGPIYEVCHQFTRSNMSDLAQHIEALATWDDLVLPEAQKSTLHDICTQVRARQKVYYQWGFAHKSHRGLGISALFAGESGTGKTMAAEVLANDLGLDLYKIDLSQVINKYIGETEKNLKKIFDAAESCGAILLFDEADALFGKRSEVKESQDRHANIEVSYLLQRMEAYRGLAILTTNMRNALDKAFLRRIRFVINFPFPGSDLRAAIWKRAFPESTPLDQLDVHRLAKLNVAGGNIKNIALNAAFMAADQDKPVNMQHLQKAAQNEYTKLEKTMGLAERLIP